MLSSEEQSLLARLRSILPPPLYASRPEKVLSCLGALLGIFLAEKLSLLMLGSVNPWFIAPMGASAVLLFAVPSSPLAQPWSILGGNILAATIGVSLVQFLGPSGLAASLSVGLSIAAMFFLRCIHPPSGAVALTAVLGGPAVTRLGYHFVLFPMLVNSLALLLMALVFNKACRRNYPQRAAPANPHGTKDPLPSERLGFTAGDLEKALQSHSEFLPISKEDLTTILTQAEISAHRRRFGNLRCVTIMSRDVVTVLPDQSLAEAWGLLRKHDVKALPVTDEEGQLVGILSLHDFISGKNEDDYPRPESSERLVKDIMTSDVVTAAPEQPIAELIQLFSDSGLHHMPVIDRESQVMGILTQSDVLAALFQSQLKSERFLSEA